MLLSRLECFTAENPASKHHVMLSSLQQEVGMRTTWETTELFLLKDPDVGHVISQQV